ncbi:hypothetical protein [Streptomyces vinaceus]|uniref:hypothetical protein n=1 Tax=Streptomyces vinaceus TaxID=1960 RepID=UPI0037FDBE49
MKDSVFPGIVKTPCAEDRKDTLEAGFPIDADAGLIPTPPSKAIPLNIAHILAKFTLPIDWTSSRSRKPLYLLVYTRYTAENFSDILFHWFVE